jgi:hypothetical protein
MEHTDISKLFLTKIKLGLYMIIPFSNVIFVFSKHKTFFVFSVIFFECSNISPQNVKVPLVTKCD